MQLRFQEFDDFLILFKPYGIRMHQVDEGQFGFVEAISAQLQKPLFLVHRLDKQTSGLCIMAKSKQAAAGLSELFEKKNIKKTYFFLTSQSHEKPSFKVETHIEKKQNHFVNNLSLPANSETQLSFIKKVGTKSLWKAEPKSGKPHQIRLHASLSGIPVSGDSQHQGDAWFRLALHSAVLEFNWNGVDYVFKSELPPSFSDDGQQELTLFFQDAYYNKTQLFSFTPSESLRLVHEESESLKADLFGGVLWVYDYSEKGLTPSEQDQIQSFSKVHGFELVLRHMLDRGAGVGGLERKTLLSNSSLTNWTAQEEKTNYQFRTDAGFSPGLFMDQRENRKWVYNHAADQKVLNLFCYTSGFSVEAAKAGAQQVTSVDVSKKFLEWSKENFKLNNLDVNAHEFFAQDCLLFLKGSVKRKRQWDLIICDPPSFGRSQDSVWKIERSISELADLMWQCLQPGGIILFTCNYEEWSRHDLIKQFSKGLSTKKFAFEKMPFLSLDYGETDELKNLMKGFILRKPTS